MLKRLYIHNFRCLVNFEVTFDEINLLLGANGTGKSSIFEVLRRLQHFVIEDTRIHDIFPARDLTLWQRGHEQRFEIELLSGEETYIYSLLIDHHPEHRRMRVLEEKLTHQGNLLFACREGTAQLYHDDYSEGPAYPFDSTLSGVGSLQARPENKKITRFKKELGKLIIVRPMPIVMEQEGRGEEERPKAHMENFVSWYRSLAQEYMGNMGDLLGELRLVLPGFDSMSLKESGEDVRTLKVHFTSFGGGSPMSLDFSALSEGQKMLIALYTLVFALKNQGISLFIDEPDNFLALREIQPWLTTLDDAVGEILEQAVLISHHPEIINYLGNAHGKWFQREGQGPVREVAPPEKGGLPPAEIIVRGWDTQES